MQGPVSRQAPLAACRYAEAASFRRFTGRYERLKYLAHFPCQDTSLDVAPTYLFSGGIAAAPSVAGRATSSGGRRTEVWYRAWTAGRVGAGGGGGGCRCLPEGIGAAAVLCRLRCCRARAHQGRPRRSLKAEPTESASGSRDATLSAAEAVQLVGPPGADAASTTWPSCYFSGQLRCGGQQWSPGLLACRARSQGHSSSAVCSDSSACACPCSMLSRLDLTY